MSIRPVMFNGMIQRTDDVGQMKQHEDQKPMLDQQAIQGQVAEKERKTAQDVVESQEESAMENHADAREEGKNKYRSIRKKKKEEDKDGRVVKKQVTGSFDFKI